MKRLLTIVMGVVVCACLCSCSLSASKIQSNLTEENYSVIEMDEERLTELNKELKYSYKGSGSIITGFYAVHNETKGSITVLEFQNKNDLTLMYKIAKESMQDGEDVDLSGYILVFGDQDGVKVALN